MVVDFKRSALEDIEKVSTYNYTLYKMRQSRLCFFRRLGSFNICSKLLFMFYQSAMASVCFYAVECWGGSTKTRDAV